MIGLRLGARASGVRVALWGGKEGGGKNRGHVLSRSSTSWRLCGAGRHWGMQPWTNDARVARWGGTRVWNMVGTSSTAAPTSLIGHTTSRAST